MLQRKTVKLCHRAHQGISKTKAYARTFCWFPGIDHQIEQKVRKCPQCQAVQDADLGQPIKPRELPEGPWQQLEMDFQGPYPTGQYILAAIDRYTRWPEIDFLRNTPDGKSTKKAMKRIFASEGIPEVCQSDNGSPFQSEEMNIFAKECGYRHQHVTPVWPRANGTVERFNRTMKEAIQTACVEGVSMRKAAQEFVEMYRATPHSATGISPYAAMHGGRQMRTRLPTLIEEEDTVDREKDKRYREKMAETRKGMPHTFKTGDKVLIKQARKNKLTPRYNPESLTVVDVRGSSVVVSDGRTTIMRDGSHFKKMLNDTEEEEESAEEAPVGRDEPSSMLEECEVLNEPINQSEVTAPAGAQASFRENDADSTATTVDQPEAETETDVRPRSTRSRRSPTRYGDYVYY